MNFSAPQGSGAKGPVLVLDYGAGNLHSAAKALTRAGLSVRLSTEPDDLPSASAIVVPGQGHFRQVMDAFESSGFRQPLLRAIEAGTPLLGICVGMQLLFEASEEAPGTRGLGVLRGTLKRFEAAPGHKVPQMGWNSLRAVGHSPLLRGLDERAYAYFVHSYYAPAELEVQHGAVSDYGAAFWSVISHGNVHATQFHPEKSGEVGLALLRRFAAVVKGEVQDQAFEASPKGQGT